MWGRGWENRVEWPFWWEITGPGEGKAWDCSGRLQVQKGEGLCGLESDIFVQRQLSPRNMVEAGVSVEVFSYSHPAPDAGSCYPPGKK